MGKYIPKRLEYGGCCHTDNYDMKMHYDKFEDWFWEVEGFSTRGERFYDEFMQMTPERAVEWLQAVWDCARRINEQK